MLKFSTATPPPPPPQYRASRGKAKWHGIRGADFTVYCIIR